jgi:hypothetical protein
LLRRQLRAVRRSSGGRVSLKKDRQQLLLAVGEFVDGAGFENRDEAARALGIEPYQLYHLTVNYQRLLRSRRRAPLPARRRKFKLARVKIVEEPVERTAISPKPIELILASGVRVSMGSADEAIELLDRLDQRERLKGKP